MKANSHTKFERILNAGSWNIYKSETSKNTTTVLQKYENRPKNIVKVLRFQSNFGFKLIVWKRIHIPNLNEFWMRVHEIFTSPEQVIILL